ncbi:MAG: ATP-binding protein [Promethearchaeota archaeon]
MISKEDMKLFFSETEDLIQKIEDNVLILEENPENDKPIQNLFFVYHTLKGLTAMVGLDNLSKFSHFFENFLEKNKNFKEQVEQKAEFINLLFESLDVIRNTINKVKNGVIKDLDPRVLKKFSASFDDFDFEYEITFFKPITIKEIKKAATNKKNRYFKIYIRIQSTCVFKKVRLYIIFRALNEIGRICSSKPEPDVLEGGNFNNDFEIYLMSQQNSGKVKSVINEILEIETNIITEIQSNDFISEIKEFCLKQSRKIEQKAQLVEKSDFMKKTEYIKEQSGNISSIVDDLMGESGKITSVKVNINVLEQLMDNFGEVIILKNQISQILKDKRELSLNKFFDNMDKQFLEIQEIIFKLKLVRVESTFRRYRRLVRDLAKETRKNIRFILEGTDVEIDRKVLEELNSPLIHVIRNAIYHGIETPNERKSKNKNPSGILKLKTYRRAGSIYIEIEDDGKGIDYEKIREKVIEKGMYTEEIAMDLDKDALNQIIFTPGFSTLEGADLISGRGMGLAIVAEKIEELGGSLNIYSEKDQGTMFTIDVPFTRAILKAQLLKVGSDLFAIPIENIQQIYFFKRELIEYVKGKEYYRLDSQLIPIIRLTKYLDFIIQKKEEIKSNSSSKIAILCMKDKNNSAVFIADEILQQMEVVIKPFRTKYSSFQEILGTSITGDGTICLILDVLNIISSIKKEFDMYQSIEAEATL